jgi:hypothetical protein
MKNKSNNNYLFPQTIKLNYVKLSGNISSQESDHQLESTQISKVKKSEGQQSIAQIHLTKSDQKSYNQISNNDYLLINGKDNDYEINETHKTPMEGYSYFQKDLESQNS